MPVSRRRTTKRARKGSLSPLPLCSGRIVWVKDVLEEFWRVSLSLWRVVRTGRRGWPSSPGKLLDDILAAVDLTRQDVYLTNIVKCRAAVQEGGRMKNRQPRTGEIRACNPYL